MVQSRKLRLQWPVSLKLRFALGYLLVALGSVLIVAFSAYASIHILLENFQYEQILSSATDLSQQIGTAMSAQNLSIDQALCSVQSCMNTPNFPRNRIILEDTHGNIYVYSNGGIRQDASDLTAQEIQSLKSALSGSDVTGSFNTGTTQNNLFVFVPPAAYAATPVRVHNSIVGAVYLAPNRFPAARRTLLARTPSSPINQIALLSILIPVIAVAILMGIIGFVLARTVTNPLERLRVAASKMANGDYHSRVQVDRSDELGQLAQAFNDMSARIESNIAEMKQQEDLRRELVANVTHDLATPLTAIQGYIEALADGVVHNRKGREESYQVINKELGRLKRLVAEMHEMTGLESGTVKLDIGPLNLHSLVDSTLAVVQQEYETKGVQLTSTVPENLPLVGADSDKITQVLLNLLDNALRYTPEGKSVEVKGTSDNGVVTLAVRDTGSGIAPADLVRIFDRFYRADPSRTGTTGGSGLGLAIAKTIITAHGGRISAESKVGEGTTIIFTLPVVS